MFESCLRNSKARQMSGFFRFAASEPAHAPGRSLNSSQAVRKKKEARKFLSGFFLCKS